MTKKIGIMGGTFNPIHCGHLFIAEEVMSYCFLDEIIFVPTGTPPHKRNEEILEGEIRYNMVQEAIEFTTYFQVTDIEINRMGYSYSIDTLMELKRINFGARLYFILGADAFLYLKKWKAIEEIQKYCSFIVVARPGYDKILLDNEAKLLFNQYGIESQIINIEGINISSTIIRKRIKIQRPIKYLVPEGVRKTIIEKNLYR